MREIKFRAFDLDDKEMIEVSALDWSDGKIISLNYPNGKKYSNDEMGDRVSIMQYTGLKDKNDTGKEIYFDDIVYISGYGNLHIKNMSDLFQLYEALAEGDVGEIKGNIYENPELIS